MNALASFSPPARGLIVAGAFALVVTLLEAAAPLLSPILLAIFIAIIAIPAINWMRRKGAPKWLALVVVAFVLLDIGSLLALLARRDGKAEDIEKQARGRGNGDAEADVVNTSSSSISSAPM